LETKLNIHLTVTGDTNVWFSNTVTIKTLKNM